MHPLLKTRWAYLVYYVYPYYSNRLAPRKRHSSRCVFVGDAGMVSQDNLQKLSESGGKYILCMPMRRGDEVTQEVLQRPGRYQQVADNLRVKEVVVGEGERRRRYVVCHNPEEEKRQR
jgi:transposase